MKRLLIISKEQFGYHTDIYKWCQYLRDDYDIEVVTFGGKEIVEMEGVTNHYVSNRGTRSVRGIRYILTCLCHILFFKGVILVCYFRECHILKRIFPRKKMLLDIRTLDVSSDVSTRHKENALIKQCTDLYDYVTIISEGLRKKINLDDEKSAVLPLGADPVSVNHKTFENLRLLYVGTLFNRDVHKTIEGLNLVIKSMPEMDVHYDIVGDGLGDERIELQRMINEMGIDDKVTLHGYIQHSRLNDFLDKCNVGVSFVPITEYYDFQPATKSFEYILSGLYTIATGTYCNKEIINESNGVIIDDTPEAFASAVLGVYNHLGEIQKTDIQLTLSDYTWKNIVNIKMKAILDYFVNIFSI